MNTTSTPTRPAKRTAKRRGATQRIFVLDTCVLLHDHSALRNFEEHRVAVPLTVLEELDTFKVGTESKHFEARQTVRLLDELSSAHDLNDWIPIEPGSMGRIKVVRTGRLRRCLASRRTTTASSTPRGNCSSRNREQKWS